MARIFITGSSDGLGSLAAQRLIKRGHVVVLHARNAQRAADAQRANPGAEACLIGDLSSVSGTKLLASELNKHGPFDTIIHNAGVYRLGGINKTGDGFPTVTAVNTFAPYILTCLVQPRPKRLVYLSSSLHAGGDASTSDVTFANRNYSDAAAYADSKLHSIMFAQAFARRFPHSRCNSMDPGWVATKMGGPSATGSLEAAVDTYVYLATEVTTTGGYWRPGVREEPPKQEANEEANQEKLIKVCEAATGVKAVEVEV
ncbi:hypothetical protein DV735_g388, partial [Chaetothyriales sp. CBS 134920]